MSSPHVDMFIKGMNHGKSPLKLEGNQHAKSSLCQLIPPTMLGDLRSQLSLTMQTFATDLISSFPPPHSNGPLNEPVETGLRSLSPFFLHATHKKSQIVTSRTLIKLLKVRTPPLNIVGHRTTTTTDDDD